MADGLEVAGIGKIAWTFEACDKSEIQIITDGYYVPDGRTRLLSPQEVFNEQQGVSGLYKGDGKFFSLCLEGLPSIYHCSSELPVAKAIPGECSPSVHLSVFTDCNRNLTGGQKVLLELHYCFCHLGMNQVQEILRQFPFVQYKYSVAAKCDLPVCEICEFAKVRHCPKQSLVMTKRVTHDGSLKIGDLRPGSTISVDHSESRLFGCTFYSYGGPSADKIDSECIFVDHASVFIHVEH